MSEQNEIKRLSSIIERKDLEIQDIKTSLANILQQIRDINESVNEIDPEVKRRKISELCTDTRYELLIDEIDGFYQKEKTQIIKLPITDQSHR